MRFVVNGNEVEGVDGSSILDLLIKNKLDRDRVVVEVNGEIVKKELWGEVILKEKDAVVLLSFVGGG